MNARDQSPAHPNWSQSHIQCIVTYGHREGTPIKAAGTVIHVPVVFADRARALTFRHGVDDLPSPLTMTRNCLIIFAVVRPWGRFVPGPPGWPFKDSAAVTVTCLSDDEAKHVKGRAERVAPFVQPRCRGIRCASLLLSQRLPSVPLAISETSRVTHFMIHCHSEST